MLSDEFAVIAVTESWLDQEISDHDIVIDGFEVHRKDLNDNQGGTLIYASKSLTHWKRNDLEIATLQAVWIEIRVNNKKILVSSIYRPPGQTAIER